MSSVGTVNQSRHGISRPGTKIATFLAAGALLFTAACSSPAETPVENPSRVLQSVNVDLSPDGSIKTIAGTAVYYDEAAGTSSSSTTDYEAADVFNDLPVRVSTQYRTDSSSGSNLEELAGFTGQIELEFTLENLTVASQDVTFDVAGQSQVTPALIGVPLSIAASTKLEGITPSAIVTGSEADSATNGIISADAEGDAIIQWAAVIAPPMTGATTTFTLVADVTDFVVPNIDVALQTGLHTDLSYEGVLNSAFDTDPTSDLALQQRTISVITDVNSVLTKAGTTISEVRTNLEDTSATLGVRTAQQLRDSSESLAGTMQRVGGELTALEADLNATVSGTNDSVSSQLAQTVGSMNAMLGDTSATPPLLKEGEGCSARVETPESGATIYSAFLQLSGQLDAYASANAECRDEIVIELQSTIGPRDPDQEICDEEESLTCALYDSRVTISAALVQLVVAGEKIADSLDPSVLVGTIGQYTKLSEDIKALLVQIDELKGLVNNEDVVKQLDEILKPKNWDTYGSDLALITDVNEELRTQLETHLGSLDAIAKTAGERLEEVPRLIVPEYDDSMLKQTKLLAGDLCEAYNKGLILTDENADQDAPETIDKLLGYLTGADCDGSALETEELPLPILEALDAQELQWNGVFKAQTRQWNDVLKVQSEQWTAVEEQTAEAGVIVGELAESDLAVDSITQNLSILRASLVTARDKADSQRGDLTAAQTEISGLLDALNLKAADLKEDLNDLNEQQLELPDSIRNAFETAKDDTKDQVSEMIEDQIREVSDQAEQGQDSLIAAYNRTIADLSTTSTEVLVDSGKLIDSQKAQLEESAAQTIAALSNQTVLSLERIAASSNSSTRDVEAASVLLGDNLNRVLLDLGDRNVQGSGLLGAISASAAKAETADYQLALASQNASGYANIRSQDITAILLKQAQFEASLSVATAFPAFHLDIPSGSTSTTMYSFHLGGTAK